MWPLSSARSHSPHKRRVFRVLREREPTTRTNARKRHQPTASSARERTPSVEIASKRDPRDKKKKEKGDGRARPASSYSLRVHRLPRFLGTRLLRDERSVASGPSTTVAWKSAPRTGRASSGVVVSTGSPRRWRRRPMGDVPSRPVDITVHCLVGRTAASSTILGGSQRAPSPSAQRTRYERT